MLTSVWSQINYLAVLGAGITHMVANLLWFSPLLFGPAWAKLTGSDSKPAFRWMPAGILGHLRPLVVIGWWAAWSVFELVVRLKCKPWVRQGPLLSRMRRPATSVQMAFYVLTKNVLIGALLFLIMSMAGGVT